MNIITSQTISQFRKKFRRALVEFYGKNILAGVRFIKNLFESLTRAKIPDSIDDLYAIIEETEKTRPDIFIHINEKKITFASKIIKTSEKELEDFFTIICTLKRPARGSVYKFFIRKNLRPIINFLEKNQEKLNGLHELLLHESMLRIAQETLSKNIQAEMFRFLPREQSVIINIRKTPLKLIEIFSPIEGDLPPYPIIEILPQINEKVSELIISYSTTSVMNYVTTFLEEYLKSVEPGNISLHMLEKSDRLLLSMIDNVSVAHFEILRQENILNSSHTLPSKILDVAMAVLREKIYTKIIISKNIQLQLHAYPQTKFITLDENWSEFIKEEIKSLKTKIG